VHGPVLNLRISSGMYAPLHQIGDPYEHPRLALHARAAGSE
jgi:hypothetical protein